MRTIFKTYKRIIAFTLIIVLLTGSVSPYAYAANMTDSIYDMAEQDVEKPADMDETVQGSAYLDPEVAEDGTPETGADLLADVLTTEEMEETLPLNSLTGDWSEDLLQVAQSQEDIPESILNYTEDEDGTVHPYSRYGDWAGIPYGKWDAAFVSFCLHYAGIPEVAFSHYTDTSEWVISLMDAGSFLAPGTYEPLPGDIVFLGPAGALDGLTAEEDDDDYNVYIDKDVRVGIVLDTRAVTETDSETGEEIEIPVMDVITGDAGDSIYGEYYTPDQLAAMQSEETTEYSDGPDRVRTVTCRTDAEEILGYASLPEEYTKQTMEARIYEDASMEELAEDPADGIRLVGDLPDGGYAAAYPADAAPSNGAKSWLSYEISLFDRDGNKVQPSHGSVRLEFHGTTVGEAIAQSGGLSFYHVTSDEEGAQETLAAYLENGDAAAKLEVLDGDEGAAGSGVVYCEAERFSTYILGTSAAAQEENAQTTTSAPKKASKGASTRGVGEPTRAANDVYQNGMIYISNFDQLQAIGTNEPVKTNDPTSFGEGDFINISVSDEEPIYLTYSNDAIYYLTNDIKLTSSTAWSVPAGFMGTFTSAAANGNDNSTLLIDGTNLTVYDSGNVYFYNRYQMAAAADADTTNDTIHAQDFDPFNYGDGNNTGGSYTGTNNTYYLSEKFTAKTEYDVSQSKLPYRPDGAIIISTYDTGYQQLKRVGVGKIVDEERTINEVPLTKTVTYPSDGVYYLANDIEMTESADNPIWQLPADFTGSFTCDKTTYEYSSDCKRVYVSEGVLGNRKHYVYIQNIYQLEVLGQSEAREDWPVLTNDYDVNQFGTGREITYDGLSNKNVKYDSASGNIYKLSRTFSIDPATPVSGEVSGQIENTGIIDGRDYFGQTTVDIGGTTYILIGDRQQLDAIGSDWQVHEPVYKVTQTRGFGSTKWITDTVELEYPGDADLIGCSDSSLLQAHPDWKKGVYVDSDGQAKDFSKSRLYNDPLQEIYGSGIKYEYDGFSFFPNKRTVYCASDGKGGYDLSATRRSSGSGPLKYSKDANYIIFRDIDMRVHANEDKRDSEVIEESPVWRPLMFTGTMIGAKITREEGEKIWNEDKTGITASVRPEISYIYIEPELVTYEGVVGCLDLEKQEGVGFFGTITSEINNSTYNETKAEVRNLKLIHGVVNNEAVYSKVQDSLLHILTDNVLGRLLDDLLGLLLSALTGKQINLSLSELLDTRRGDPNNVATGAFAGKIVGQVTVEDCEVECFSVTTKATLYETGTTSFANEAGGKIVGKGGFVGHVEGTPTYSGLSNVLGSLTTLLTRILNLLPGVGLGDLITLLLHNVLAVKYLVPTGYNAPEISRCTVSKTVLSNEEKKFGVGGFAGSVEGVRIADCLVSDCDYMIVNADMFGGGFAGIVRDAVINTTLSGLGVNVTQNLNPNGELVNCAINDSDIIVRGGSVLGGFVGILCNSYAFNDTVDGDSRIIVESARDAHLETDHKRDYIGGFAGEAMMGSLVSLGSHIQNGADLLGTVTGALTQLVGNGSPSQALLDLAGVAPSAVMGCQVLGSVEVSTQGSNAGGLIGFGEGTLVTKSEETYIRKLHKYREAGTILPIKERKKNNVSRLVSVRAGSYAGGVAGFVRSASSGGLLGDTVGIGKFLKFTVCDTDVKGISLTYYAQYYSKERPQSMCSIEVHESKFRPYKQQIEPDDQRKKDGYTVTAESKYAGGGFGCAIGGDIYDVELTELQSVTAGNYAGGFVGATGPGDLLGAGGLNLKLLGIDLVNASNLLSIGDGVRTAYMRANVTGIADGFTVEEKGKKTDNEADYTAGGYAGLANSVTVTDCHVNKLLSVKANMQDGIAGGFVGQSSAGGLASLLEDGNADALKALTVNGLLGAVPYMIPKFEGNDVTYVDGGFVEGDTAGGFAGDFQSGYVNKAIRDEVADAGHEKRDPNLTYLKYPEDTFADQDSRSSETKAYSVGTNSAPWSVKRIHHVRGGQFAGGWGGKVYSGALASAGGGISLLSSSVSAGGDIGTLNVTDLLSLAQSYVPFIAYAGINSYYPEKGNYGFSVYAAHEEPTRGQVAPATSGYAGGFIGYGSGVQVSYSDVNRLKTGSPTEPNSFTEADKAAYVVTGIWPDVLESQDGGNYMNFINIPDEIPYAVAGAYYAGGYIGHMDVGSAASVGKGLQLLGSLNLQNVLDTLNVVVSTIEHSNVYGAGGGFSVIASPRINHPEGTFGDNENHGVSHAGGFAGKISGGHVQDSDVNNFYYIIGEISAGGYVGEAVPGDVGKVLGGDSGTDTGVLDLLKENGVNLANISNLASLVQDFVPTIRNSETNCVPCGGAVRAECPTDVIAAGNTVMRGMAGGYVGHSVGAQIWGMSDDTWKSENDAKINGNTVYLDADHTKPNWTVGDYQGPQNECSAYRIRSVYGREYAGGYCGLMECGSTAQTGGLSLLGGLVSTNNLAGALQAVYPVIRHGQVTGPIRGTSKDVWNDWIEYVGMKGGFAPELAREGAVNSQNELDAIAAKYIYGTHVVAGRHTYESTTYKILSGCAGGFVGSMHSGVIRDSSALDTKLVSAMRAAGGFAGEMQTKGLAELGSVSLLGIDLQLGNLLQAGSVFVPVITGSGTTGYQKGLTVEAHGDSTNAGVGCAGGYAGGVYGGQIGNKQSNGGTYPDVWVDGLRTVYGTNAIGGFAGKIAAASVLDVDTEEVSNDYLQTLLNYVTTSPGNLVTLAQATYSTVKNARVSAADPEWGFVVDGEYNNGGKKYADYAGGFVGHVEAAVIGERKIESDNTENGSQNNDDSGDDSNDGDSNNNVSNNVNQGSINDRVVVTGLRGVIGGYYAGGFFGYGTTGSVAQVGGNNSIGAKTKLLRLIQLGNVSVLDAFRTYIYHSEVHGVNDGIRVYAHNAASANILNTNRLSGCAGGFGGALMNGTVENSFVEDLNYIEGPEYAAGMIAYMGKGGGIAAEEVSVVDDDDDDPNEVDLNDILRVLGLDLGATAQLLNIVGSTVEYCRAAGFEDGFIVKTTQSQSATKDTHLTDLIGTCAAGFTGFGDVSQIENCNVENLRYIMSPQIAAGFIGRGSVAYLADVNAQSPLIELLLNIINTLVKALYLNQLQNIDLVSLNGSLLGLNVLSEGNVLSVNLFGLKISVSVAQPDPQYGGEALATITLGSSTITLPCDENGINTSSPDLKLNLIEGNRTCVKGSYVKGIPVGYDVFGNGSDQDNSGETGDAAYWGYAGGFVGYNDNGYFSHDRMWLCDVVKGASEEVGPFSGKTIASSRSEAYLEGDFETNPDGNDNWYSIYRSENSSTFVATANDNKEFGVKAIDNQGEIRYNRYDVQHYKVIKQHRDLKDAYEAGSGENIPLKAWISAGEADLMLNTPLTPNGESEAIEPDDLKDPCAETFELHIHKKWRDYGNLLGQRPDSIEVEVLAIDVGTQPRWQLVQTIFSESDGNIVNENEQLSGTQIGTRTVRVTADRNGKWKLDVKGLPVAYVATVPDLDDDGNQKTEPLYDEQNQPVYEQEFDENDNPVPVLIPLTKTEVHYLQYVVTEKPVENYKVPQYEIKEDTASVIITNELDGIILPGTGADGIYKLLMLGLAIFTLGAFLFLRRYRQMRNSAVRSAGGRLFESN